MIADTAAPKSILYDELAFELRRLLLRHRQFQEAVDRFAEFNAAAAPDYWSTAPVVDDAAGFNFAEDDDNDGDAHTQSLIVVGPSGAGKSSFLKWIARLPEHKCNLHGPDGDIRPVVRINVPDPASPKEVVKEICAEMAAPPPVSWTRNEISRHLRTLFRDVGVRYLLMDEAHVFSGDVTARTERMNARFLKFMLVSCRVPIILAGEEPLEKLLSDRALSRRMHAPIRLGPYLWGQQSQVAEWLGLTTSLTEQLGFADSATTSDIEFLMRLYLDTGGLIGQLAERLIEAGRFAVQTGSNELEKTHFAAAWRRWSSANGGIALDPYAIVADSKGRLAENPYTAPPEELKALWRRRFHTVAEGNAGRITRRRSRKERKERSFAE